MLNFNSTIKQKKTYRDIKIEEIEPIIKINLRSKRREFSKKIGANISITETIKSFYKELQAKGAGKLDTSSLLKRLDMLDKN